MREWAILNEELGEKMPLFMNHESARIWFKKEFGKQFVMVDIRIQNGVKFYVYHLVLNKITYVKSMNAIREGIPFVQSEFNNSYIEIEISEEGFVFLNERSA